ncbi:MAG: CehA/McbA family metallohydrolase [bacterium]
MKEIVGSIHFHTTYSDGYSTYQEALEEAKKANLDFIIGTDHNTLKPKEDGLEGYHNGVLLICGYEITNNFNHYLVLGTDKLFSPNERPQEFINRVKEAGGLGIIAHPYHIGIKRFGVDAFPWMDWNVEGFDCISIWDLVNDWGEHIKGYITGIKSLIKPSENLTGPNHKALVMWDRLNLQRRVPGIGETDNHNTQFKVFGIPIVTFDWEFAFRTIRNHLFIDEMTGDANKDINKILETIKRGRLFIANDFFMDSTGFDFFALLDGGRRAYMGDRLQPKTEIFLFIKSPIKAYLRLMQNGRLIKEVYSNSLTYSTNKSGVFRAEVHLQKGLWRRSWIYSNPIVIESL